MTMDQPKSYVIAAKRGLAPPADWQQRLAAIAGVEVSGATAQRAHFAATSAALDQVRAELSPWFHVEESVERKPAG